MRWLPKLFGAAFMLLIVVGMLAGCSEDAPGGQRCGSSESCVTSGSGGVGGAGGASGSTPIGGSSGMGGSAGASGAGGSAGTGGTPNLDAGVTPDADCMPATGAVPYMDHVVSEEFTDPPACPDCPGAFTGVESLNVAALPADATTVTISGTAPGANVCEWYVIGGACGVTHGVAGVNTPDKFDSFAAVLPVFCGNNVIRIVCSNDAGKRVLVRRLMGTECPEEGRDLRLTLTWDDQGNDMELHLIREGGHINSTTDDCTWFTCMPELTWGSDATQHPHKDIDNTGTRGPENIFLEHAPAGVYNILIEYWSTGMPSTNNVDITIREATVARMVRVLTLHQVWHVGTVTFPAGTFAPVDTITDCAANWRMTTMGCDLPLP